MSETKKKRKEEKVTTDEEHAKKRMRKSHSLQVKLEVLDRFDRGERSVDIQKAMGLNESTVRTIRNNAETIRKSAQFTSNLSLTRIKKTRSQRIEKMERLLSMWIENQTQQNVALTGSDIQKKARSLYEDMDIDAKPFSASYGWLERFKNRHSIQNMKIVEDDADVVYLEEFPNKFRTKLYDGDYSPRQVFYMKEMSLFWKRLPSHSLISQEENNSAGHKFGKDFCNLLLCCNATGDYKLQPLMLYHTESPRSLTGYDKEKLPVIWRANKKKWCPASIYREYFQGQLSEELKTYCMKRKIPHKILIVVEKVSNNNNNFYNINKNIQVLFVPANTVMDQGIVTNFKAYYLRQILSRMIQNCDTDDMDSVNAFWHKFHIKTATQVIVDAWDEVTPFCMNYAWVKLWPEVLHVTRDSTLENEVTVTRRDIVSMAQQVGFDQVDEDNVDELLVFQVEDVNSHLQEVPEQQLCVELENPRILGLKIMSQAFQFIDSAMNLFDVHDSDLMRSSAVRREVENALKCYREIYNKKLKTSRQLSVQKFLKNQPVAAFYEPQLQLESLSADINISGQ